MTDYFVLLNEPRRPWIDSDALKARFLVLTAEAHPDRVHNALPAGKKSAHERYTELNTAYLCLREPRESLRHLLELERGTKLEDIKHIPPGTMDMFMEVSVACREADSLLTEKNKTTSPLLKVKLFEKAMALTEQLDALSQKLTTKRAALIGQMKILNMAWESAPPVGSPARRNVLPCNRLEHIYREFSFLSRWVQQIQERVVQLSY